MSARIRIDRVGPMCTIQDQGRTGVLTHGISASGAMDRSAHAMAGRLAGAAGEAGIELTRAGMDFTVERGGMRLGWAGGAFTVRVNGAALDWPGGTDVRAGDAVSVTPGPSGNYGYVRFGPELDAPRVMGSQSTSTRAQLGGLSGRALTAGDVLGFSAPGGVPEAVVPAVMENGPIRFIWGIHAELFAPLVRQAFIAARFRVTPMMDRMGVRLADEDKVFAGSSILSLVSDPILPGDIQILGDGTPIVLMRDHQPTGGYPRIGTVISADFDRFAQLRSGDPVAFVPVSVEHAHQALRSGHP